MTDFLLSGGETIRNPDADHPAVHDVHDLREFAGVDAMNCRPVRAEITHAVLFGLCRCVKEDARFAPGPGAADHADTFHDSTMSRTAAASAPGRARDCLATTSEAETELWIIFDSLSAIPAGATPDSP